MANAKSILRYWEKKRACVHKEAHASRGAAEAHLRALLKKDPEDNNIEAYACPHCQQWHVGHKKRRVER